MKIAFYVSGNALRLKKIFSVWEDNPNCFPEALNAINLVVSDNHNPELKEICNTFFVPYYELIERKNFSNNLLKFLTDYEIDYLFLFAGRILRGEILNKYHYKIINFHPSLLPSYKGLKAIDKALKQNDLVTGNTAHFITENVDEGPYIMKSLQSLRPFKNYDYYMNDMVPMFFQIFYWLNQKRLFVKNNRVEIENATYEFGRFIPNLEIDLKPFEFLSAK